MTLLQVQSTGGALGSVVNGLDLQQPLDEETVASLKTAFTEHSWLLFRQQSLTKADQVRFSRYFGEAVPHPTNTRDRDPAIPEVTIISNVVEAGQAIGALGNAEVHFHADLVFLHKPGSVSILYCVETPSKGGDTYWSNGYAGYEALDDAIKAKIANLQVIYEHARPEYNPPTPAIHPLVCTHPESGRKTLFVSPSSAKKIVGIDEAESHNLLGNLIDHATQPQFVWRHQWQAGDLVMWDNRCTLHRRDGFDDSQRRIMWRTQLLGHPTI